MLTRVFKLVRDRIKFVRDRTKGCARLRYLYIFVDSFVRFRKKGKFSQILDIYLFVLTRVFKLVPDGIKFVKKGLRSFTIYIYFHELVCSFVKRKLFQIFDINKILIGKIFLSDTNT